MIASAFRMFSIVLLTVFWAGLACIVIPWNKGGRLHHRIARAWAKDILATCGVKLRIAGLESLEAGRSYIFVSNHASQFDILALFAGIPEPIRFVYKKELERIPILGWSLKFGNTHIAIDRVRGADAMESLDAAAAKIRHGASVVLFAEGTRSPDGALQPFKRGPFNLACRAGVRVVPVAIAGSHRILKKGSWRITPGTIDIRLGAPIDPPAAGGKDPEFQLRDSVRAAIAHQLA